MGEQFEVTIIGFILNQRSALPAGNRRFPQTSQRGQLGARQSKTRAQPANLRRRHHAKMFTDGLMLYDLRLPVEELKSARLAVTHRQGCFELHCGGPDSVPESMHRR